MDIKEALNKLNNESKQALTKATTLNDVKMIFANNGIDVSENDLKSFTLNINNNELSDDDLENVVGGLDPTFFMQMVLRFFSDRIKDNIADKNK